MAQRSLRGLTAQQEIKDTFLHRDTRTMIQKFADFISKPEHMAAFLFVHAVVGYIYFTIALPLLISASIFFIWGIKRKEWAPVKIPIQEKLEDVNQPHPATGKPELGEGIFFIGNEMSSGKEVWLTNSDCRQHFLVVGTTGAGKTETLIGFAANAVMWGSGCIFVDGKGDVALFAKMYALARQFGREDDLLTLNFMTGNTDIGSSGGKLLSNTMNPFSTGSSDGMTQLVVSLMDDAGGDGAMWKGRATAMLTGVMRALTWLRDDGVVDLNVGTIRDYMNLAKIIDLADPEKYPDMPPQIRLSIRSYLTSLPGYQEDKGPKQSQTTLDQHGYLEMQFTKVLGSLADVYGHIFKTEYGEVDMHDVVLNRRILVVMLPALEKSGDEIANLGKIVVATLKGMMGGTLGSSIEGSWKDVVENRPTNSSSPFLVILDECGYYTVDGMALIAAQARSLGFSMIYASQDIPAMKRLNEKEASSIIANTNTKIFMRVEEAETTGKLAVESAGKANRARVQRYEAKMGALDTNYMDNLEATVEEVSRVDFVDMKAQKEGEMHILFQERVVRAKSFYADPASTLDVGKLKLRTNHFIKVARPNEDQIVFEEEKEGVIAKLVDTRLPDLLKDEAIKIIQAGSGGEIDRASKIFKSMQETGRNMIEGGAAAVYGAHQVLTGILDSFSEVAADERIPEKPATRQEGLSSGLSDNRHEGLKKLMFVSDEEDDEDEDDILPREINRRHAPDIEFEDDEDDDKYFNSRVPHAVSVSDTSMSNKIANRILARPETSHLLGNALMAFDASPQSSTKDDVDDRINRIIALSRDDVDNRPEKQDLEDIDDTMSDVLKNFFKDEDLDDDDLEFDDTLIEDEDWVDDKIGEITSEKRSGDAEGDASDQENQNGETKDRVPDVSLSSEEEVGDAFSFIQSLMSNPEDDEILPLGNPEDEPAPPPDEEE